MKKLSLIIATLLLTASTMAAPRGKIIAEPTRATPVTEAAPPQAETKATATAEFKMLGSLGFAYSEDTYVVTCGGPKFGFSYGWFSISVGLFPSVLYSNVYKNASAATPVRPNLGAGPEIGFGKVSIIAPVYYMPNNDYRYTFGIAYKF